ncbi:hypothetical protein NC652_014820 [Populus alba x Populus x berolinensis]|nr:hypothetical protein NC652_014820 [Populus alba x Populus x berolinensis]
MDVDPRHYEQIGIKDNDIHNIVLSYLVHNCYRETLESFVDCTGMPEPADYIEDMEKRKGIFCCVLEGNALKAIELTEQVACDLLENNKDLHFDLLSLHFVELVSAKKCTEALEFAQNKLMPFGKEQKLLEKLEDFLSLLAYEEPEKSPMFHLLGSEYRQHVADKLNRAILAHRNLPSYTAVERLIQQTIVVRQSLNQDHGKNVGYHHLTNCPTREEEVSLSFSAEYSIWFTSCLEYGLLLGLVWSFFYLTWLYYIHAILGWDDEVTANYHLVGSIRLLLSTSIARIDDAVLSVAATPSPSLPSLHSGNDMLPLSHFLSNRHSFSRVLKNLKLNTPNLRFCKISCGLAKAKETISTTNPDSLIKEPHKYSDQVIITVRSGDGGHGDVVIYADEGKDSLPELHSKSRFNAKRGGNVDAMGVSTYRLHNGFAASTLRIPVPVGTVVKRKRGKLLADLAQPGDEILVERGGQGGISLIEIPGRRKKRLMALTTNVMRDDSDKVLILGQPGEEVSLELILQVVADVGLVVSVVSHLFFHVCLHMPRRLPEMITCLCRDLPNAGKSSLLASITLAKPDIADYPFTTLMPNPGRHNGDPTLGAGMYSSEATLADLSGLIEGAHLGKGLGRNFLKHLRRTHVFVHVVDAAAEDPRE